MMVEPEKTNLSLERQPSQVFSYINDSEIRQDRPVMPIDHEKVIKRFNAIDVMSGWERFENPSVEKDSAGNCCFYANKLNENDGSYVTIETTRRPTVMHSEDAKGRHNERFDTNFNTSPIEFNVCNAQTCSSSNKTQDTATATVKSSSPACCNYPINTRYLNDRLRQVERPLTVRRIKILKILSVAAIVMFFPTGIPAARYAWLLTKKLEDGVAQGSIDHALKLARRVEQLTMLSAALFIMVFALILTIIEQSVNGQSSFSPNYLAHPSVQYH